MFLCVCVCLFFLGGAMEHHIECRLVIKFGGQKGLVFQAVS